MSFDDPLRDALDRALAGARADLEHAVRALAQELVDAAGLAAAAQALDAAGSLTEVLQALVDQAGRHAERAGIFLVRDGRVRPWQLRGVDAAAALQTRPADDNGTFPVVVGGSVVAILCADRVRPGSAAVLDMLARYAGRLLESMTLHKALGLVPPRGVPPRDAGADHGGVGQR
ncbi:MAG: hypothetical protein HYY76_19185 [Acidobacteria bacterium]|nr:hypothetical protein [Acidobacteriota bacterium]